MKIFLHVLLLVVLPSLLYAQPGYIEVNAPGNRQLKLAVAPPRSLDALQNPDSAKLVSDVISYDMNMSGVVTSESLSKLPSARDLSLVDVDFVPWLSAGFDLMVRGEYSLKDGQLTIEFRLFDVINRKLITAKRYLGSAKDLRRFSHSFKTDSLQSNVAK